MFQLFYKMVDALHFLRDVDALRTIRVALSASDAMVGLAQAGHAPVIAHEESAAGFPVIFVPAAAGHVSFVNAFIPNRSLEADFSWCEL